jgi:hypothetical protein
VTTEGGAAAGKTPATADRRRACQLALATIWLLDGVLQLQQFMFTPGPNGFSGMLAGTAGGNPRLVARSITWNATLVSHHPVATDAAFAFLQILLGLGIAWRPTLKAALSASIAWSVAVWWFGEGLGGVLHGAGTPAGGGPGAVLLYALLAVLLWPSDRAAVASPFVSGRAVGTTAARAIWAVVWFGLAALSLLGAGRSPQGIHSVIASVDSGEPGWLAALDRHAEAAVAGHGLAVAVVLAAICVGVGACVLLGGRWARASIAVAIVVAVVIWVVGENFGMIFAGGATDPNSGPLLALLALTYWPLEPRHAETAAPAVSTAVAS